MKRNNLVKRMLTRSAVILVVLAIGQMAKAQQLSPLLIAREAKLSPVLKQRLSDARSILAARNVKFIIGATEVSEQPVSSFTGFVRRSGSALKFNSGLNKKYSFPTIATTASKFYSMRTGNFVTDIRNQSRCGSCWNFSLIACAETNYLMKNPGVAASSIDLSEQQIMCNANAGSCYGGTASVAAKWLFDNKVRILGEGSLPYYSSLPKNGNEEGYCPTPVAKGMYKVVDMGVLQIPAGRSYPEEQAIKEAVLQHGAVTAAFWADSLVFAQIISQYGGGVYTEQEPLFTPKDYVAKPRGHQVAIIGWDDNIQCWIIKNSWGSIWGDKGFGLFHYGAHNIGTDATWVEVEKIEPFAVNPNVPGKIPTGQIDIKVPPQVRPPIKPTRPPVIRRNK